MWTTAQKKYASSSLGKAARLKYQQSLKGRESRKKYMAKRRAMVKENKQVGDVIKEPEVKQKSVEIVKEFRGKKA